MKENVKLYTSDTIDSLPWPDTEDGRYAKKYLVPFIKNGPKHYIDNIETTVMALTVDDIVLPVTFNDAEYDNSHVCSPYSHYISTAFEKLDEIPSRPAKWLLKFILSGLQTILKKGKINRVIAVNNWLLSTNLYANISQQQIEAITKTLTALYPLHAITFRSVHSFPIAAIGHLFEQNNYDLIAHREVYFTDTTKNEAFRSRMFKSDLKVLESTDYEIITEQDITPQDIPRLVYLYRALYLTKYSKFNPHINDNFIDLVLKNKLFSFIALKKNGQIDALVGYYCRNGTMTSPLFGYDTSKPQSDGLYRLISTLLILEAKNKKMLLNHSAGAGSYKKLRRAQATIEYLAVYNKHLPFSQKMPWVFLHQAMNTLGIPIMQRYKF